MGLWARTTRWISRRHTSDLLDLDRRGRMGEPPSPLLLGLATFVLVSALALLTFVVGRTEEGLPYLLIGVFGIFGLAVAIGSSLVTMQYRTMQELDFARADLLASYAELELHRGRMSETLHDAKALAAAIGATVHALAASGADPELTGRLNRQLSQFRTVLSPDTDTLESIRLGDLIDQILPFADAHELDLDVDIEPEHRVLVDARRTQQIITNLLDNARKYAPGSPIHISTRPAGPFIHLLVDDEGQGIEGDAEALFSPGVRTETSAQGFGVGLASSRTAAEAMGGALWYERRSGSGARFVLKVLGDRGDPTGEAAPG